jgi:2-polyprenyl-6-methoxyphenol hydroxylase-like FAD-dependent oxidoreductase
MPTVRAVSLEQSRPVLDRQVTPVLIAGAGPVGMTLALDLASHGIDAVLLEPALATTDNPRCNTTNARSMEYYRRLGVADSIRRSGLPLEHPTDVVYVTDLAGDELTRFRFSSSAQVLDRTAPEFDEWATPEPQHRVSQIFLEPILARAVVENPRLTLHRGWRVTAVTQSDEWAEVTAVDTQSGETMRLRARYVVGCDGASSVVRKSIGAKLEGDSRVAERRVSVYFRSSELIPLLGERPGWMYWWYGPKWRGSFVQLDGESLYLCHSRVPAGVDPAEVDPDEVLEAAVGRPIAHEKIQVVRWDPRRLVSNRFRDRRVLLAGDAAHVWLPLGGFGMNTGIADAVGLSWRLAANLQEWGGDRLFDDYEAERRSVGEATSRAALKIDTDMTTIGRDPALHADSEQGRELRRAAAALIDRTDRQQWHSTGVQFGARYHSSPGVVADRSANGHTTAIGAIDQYQPSVAPGARLPHYWREDETSIFDLLGAEWTLIQAGVDPPDVERLLSAAERRSVPLTLLALPDATVEAGYDRSLVLCRPDLFVAWSGDAVPDDPEAMFVDLLDLAPTTASIEEQA